MTQAAIVLFGFLLTAIVIFMFCYSFIYSEDFKVICAYFFIMYIPYVVIARLCDEYLYTGETNFVIREVTTNLGHKKYAVYEEKYDGKFTTYCVLQKKTEQDYVFTFFNTPEEADTFRQKLVTEKEEEKLALEHIEKVHP